MLINCRTQDDKKTNAVDVTCSSPEHVSNELVSPDSPVSHTPGRVTLTRETPISAGSPGLSPVPRYPTPAVTSQQTTAADNRPSPVEVKATARPSNFSINAILGRAPSTRACSTPKGADTNPCGPSSDTHLCTPVADTHLCTPGADTHLCTPGADTHLCTPGADTHLCTPGADTHLCTPVADTHLCTPGTDTHLCTPGADAHLCTPGTDTSPCTPGTDTSPCTPVADTHLCTPGADTHLCTPGADAHLCTPGADTSPCTPAGDAHLCTPITGQGKQPNDVNTPHNATHRKRKREESTADETDPRPASSESSSCSSCESCAKRHSTHPRRKMERTKFSKEDISALNESFWRDPYPSSQEMEKLAKTLGHGIVQIKTWFQNKRASISGTRQPKRPVPGPVMAFQLNLKMDQDQQQKIFLLPPSAGTPTDQYVVQPTPVRHATGHLTHGPASDTAHLLSGLPPYHGYTLHTLPKIDYQHMGLNSNSNHNMGQNSSMTAVNQALINNTLFSPLISPYPSPTYTPYVPTESQSPYLPPHLIHSHLYRNSDLYPLMPSNPLMSSRHPGMYPLTGPATPPSLHPLLLSHAGHISSTQQLEKYVTSNRDSGWHAKLL